MKQNIWEFVKDEDGTYSVFHMSKLKKKRIPERWFQEQICVDYGFSSNEYTEIRRQIEEGGKATIVLATGILRN